MDLAERLTARLYTDFGRQSSAACRLSSAAQC
jgi:hypothetical protein